MCVGMCVGMCVHVRAGSCRDQKRASDPLALGLQMITSLRDVLDRNHTQVFHSMLSSLQLLKRGFLKVAVSPCLVNAEKAHCLMSSKAIPKTWQLTGKGSCGKFLLIY